MKNALRIVVLLTFITAASGIANAGILISDRNGAADLDKRETCTEPIEKSLTGIIIVNVTGILITNLTGIIIVNATDGGDVNCGIIIRN